MNKAIICLMGPTAAGKTQCAVELVRKLNCEIISVDSALIYRGLDIGTAKPDAEILQQAPHRLLDICDPSEIYSVGQFYEDALQAIAEIVQQNKIPLLIGGTMQYFWRLQYGVSQSLPSADSALRLQLDEQAEKMGWPALHQQLQLIDPHAASVIHPHDSQRIQRALEVYYLTGKKISSFQQDDTQAVLPYRIINIVIAPATRERLHERIAQRLQQMFAHGFIDEVQRLYQRGDLHAGLPALRTVGYRQIWQYLAGDYDLATAKQRALFATRQLAKRQMTWLRRWSDAIWFDSDDPQLVDKIISAIQKEIDF